MPAEPRPRSHRALAGVDRARDDRHAVRAGPGWLVAFAVACLAWSIYLPLLPFAFFGGPWWTLWGLGPSPNGAPVGDPAFGRSALFALPLTCSWTLALARPIGGLRYLWSGLVVLLGFVVLSLSIRALGSGLGLPPGSTGDLLGQQAGAIAGIFGAGLVAARVGAWAPGPEGRSPAGWGPRAEWYALGALLAVLLLTPLDPDRPLTALHEAWSADSIGAYLHDIPPRLYYLYKGVLLWVPVGLLLGLAGVERVLTRWVSAAVAAFVLMSPPLYDVLAVRDVIEVALIPLGASAGRWLGAQVRLQASPATPAFESATGHSGAPVAVASAGDPPGPAARPAVSAPADAVSAGPPATTPPATASATLSRRESTARRAEPEASVPSRWSKVAGRVLGIALLAGVALAVWEFPRWQLGLAAGLAVYVLVLWRYPGAWLVGVPAALPLLDLAPWTGRFFLDEFDLLLGATTAMGLWHATWQGRAVHLAKPLTLLLMLFTVCYGVSALRGLWPFPELDANAFSSYWSHYNALRVGKGLFWALVLFALLRSNLAQRPRETRWLLALGMTVGFVGVLLVGLHERWLFAGLLDYRLGATFSSAHTGGAPAEAYLVTALPFLGFWLLERRSHLGTIAGATMLLLGAVAASFLISREGIVALVAGLAVLAAIGLASAWRDRPRWTAPAPYGVAAADALAVLVAGGTQSGGGPSERGERGFESRLPAGSTVAALMGDDWPTRLFGVGLGRFPESHLLDSVIAGETPGTYRFEHDGAEQFLRLGGGESMWMGQRVAVKAVRNYTLSVRARTEDPPAALTASLCERNRSQELRCQRYPIALATDSHWHRLAVKLRSGEIGAGSVLSRRPVEVLFSNTSAGSAVDLDDVQLAEARGENLVRNGDFSRGGDHWLFKTDTSRPWEIGSLWFAMLFELGWVGLLAFNLLVGFVAAQLIRAALRGERLAAVVLASLVGFLGVGLNKGLLDAPRLTSLFFFLVLYGALLAGRNSPASPEPAH